MNPLLPIIITMTTSTERVPVTAAEQAIMSTGAGVPVEVDSMQINEFFVHAILQVMTTDSESLLSSLLNVVRDEKVGRLDDQIAAAPAHLVSTETERDQIQEVRMRTRRR